MTVELLQKAMKAVTGAEAIDLKGKKYTQVNVRVKEFRTIFGLEYGIETSYEVGAKGVIFTTHIKTKDGFIVGTGHSFTNDFTNAFKGLEKAETTAVGRALASIGLGGDEYASVDEINSVDDRLLQEDIQEISTQDKMMQRDAFYEIGCAMDEFKIDGIVEQYSNLPEPVLDAIKDQADTRKKQIENGVNPKPSYGFINVKEAADFCSYAGKEIDAINTLDELDIFERVHSMKIDAIDNMLKSDKYKKDGKTAGQRFKELIETKRNKLTEK